MCFGCYIQIKELWPFASCKMWKWIWQCIFTANSNTSNDNRPTNSWRRRETNSELLVNCNKQFIIFHSIVSPITSHTPAHHRFGFFVFFLSVIILSFSPISISLSFFFLFFLYYSFFMSLYFCWMQFHYSSICIWHSQSDGASNGKIWTSTIRWDLLMNRNESNLKKANDK